MKSKITKITILLTSICLVIIFINCKPKKMETFEWDATSCAPKFYPMGVYQATFIFENGNAMDIPGADFMQNGWGDASSFVCGDNSKPIPERLELTWLSYTENKFYTGSFLLPKDSIINLFKEGFTEFQSKKHGTYNVINVGMAPGGIVVVWLMGAGKSVDVGRYQAKDTVVSMRDFIPTAQIDDQTEWVNIAMGHNPEVADSIKKFGIPYGLWDSYRERFNWRPVIDFEDKESTIIDEIMVYYLNNEIDQISNDRLITNAFGHKARVKKITCWWSNKRTISKLKIHLEEEEIFKAYRFIYQNNPEQEGQLRIQISKNEDYVRIFLENTDANNHREIQLHKVDIKIYPVDEIDRSYFTVFKDEYKKE